MPKLTSNELTEEIYRRLCGRVPDELADKVVLVHTVDSSGWPHPAILSYFEVAATDRQNIRVAMYKTSHTTENMRRTGRVTLSIFDEHIAWYIKGAVSELRREMRSAPHNSMLNLVVQQVLIDKADPALEPGAYIASGITCVNPHREVEGARAAAVLKELLE